MQRAMERWRPPLQSISNPRPWWVGKEIFSDNVVVMLIANSGKCELGEEGSSAGRRCNRVTISQPETPKVLE